jgi:4-hydroxy-tetrahydrodipicolinate synthase
LGTSGEGTFLTDDQRRSVLETVVAEVSGQVPVLAGAIDTSTARAGEHVDAALKVGVDAVVATAPFYAATHPAEIERHFTRLATVAGDTPPGVPGFAIMTGSEVTVDSALGFGVDGVVPGLGNVDPAGYVRIFDAVAAGDRDTARQEQDRLFRLFEIVEAADRSRMGASSAALGAFKGALFLLGVIACPLTAYPSIPLDDVELDRVRAVLERAGLR